MDIHTGNEPCRAPLRSWNLGPKRVVLGQGHTNVNGRSQVNDPWFTISTP